MTYSNGLVWGHSLCEDFYHANKDFARLLNKRDSEISKWLTGRHNFTTQTIARIETALGSKLISIAH